MRSLSRRDIFPAIGATALAGIAAAGFAKPETLTAAPTAKPEGKSPIIKARDEYFSARADVERIGDEPAATPGHPHHQDNNERSLAACEAMWAAIAFLAHTPAKNLHDLKAKTEVANIEFPEYCDAFVMEETSDEVQLAISIISDLHRLSAALA
ncbi:hypothetical protein OQ252_03940 [Acetobacter farinalis]|uniref:Twin-arginine translocation signal domain-containing protein n=1 Tax=Acetobacter farinalis TaxID=1260984 RepID=A0ABT3Q5J3_9PROT|nr:hypothetical protein [Acetobacter farinalis]MCX2560558.1 hypothetical protein [Acetobacter farinalis]NHO29301.1 hypothetical protein [Acetobacter farinalis]